MKYAYVKALAVLVLYFSAISNEESECVPPCRKGFLCHKGECISSCNPPCPDGYICDPNIPDCVPVNPIRKSTNINRRPSQIEDPIVDIELTFEDRLIVGLRDGFIENAGRGQFGIFFKVKANNKTVLCKYLGEGSRFESGGVVQNESPFQRGYNLKFSFSVPVGDYEIDCHLGQISSKYYASYNKNEPCDIPWEECRGLVQKDKCFISIKSDDTDCRIGKTGNRIRATYLQPGGFIAKLALKVECY